MLPLLALALLAVACAVTGPSLGSPDPAVMATILFSSLVSGTAGFAFSAICGGILFHLWDDQVQVVQVMILCSIANQATMVWVLRREIDWRSLSRLLAGAAFGLPIGVWALLHADRHLYTRALGVFLLAYSVAMLLDRIPVLGQPRRGADIVVGFVAGITGGAAALPGAPVTIWSHARGLDRVGQRALFQPFILILQVGAMVAISLSRRGEGTGFGLGNLLCVPAGLFGTLLGMTVFRRLSNRQFACAVKVMLIVSGLSLAL